MAAEPKLLFVYNAKSGLFNAVADYAHKLFSPATYPCQLCSLTYGNFGMFSSWKKFLKRLPVNSEFLYQDTFQEKYHQVADLPAIFLETGGTLNLFLSRNEIEACADLETLMTLIQSKIH